MAIKGLDAAEQLLVVACVDQDLGVVLHGVRQHGEGAGVELFLLDLLQLLGSHFRLCLRRSHLLLGVCEVLMNDTKMPKNDLFQTD